MTSPLSDIRRLCVKARLLVERHGVCVNAAGMRLEELHIKDYWFVVFNQARLEIRTGFVREILILYQIDRGRQIERVHEDRVGECLDALDRAFVLDELADV